MIQMQVLGSGSSGNCTVLRLCHDHPHAAHRTIMIDAGLGPRAVARRLGPDADHLDQLDALLLTHLDRDHFNPAWFVPLARRRVTLYCHQKHLHTLYRHPPTTRENIDARALHRQGLLHPFTNNPFTLHNPHLAPAPTVQVHPLPLAHDRTGVVGFDIRTTPPSVAPDLAPSKSPNHKSQTTNRLAFATDLGRVPQSLIHAFRDVDLLAIESNYDPDLQHASARPRTLKQRIMGGRGHLSNHQALNAIRQIVDASTRPPDHIVLLHLSRQCNCPNLLRNLYQHHPDLAQRLCLTHHRQPTPWLAVTATPDGHPHRPPPPTAPLHHQMLMFPDP